MITEDEILTAAHCVRKGSIKMKKDMFYNFGSEPPPSSKIVSVAGCIWSLLKILYDI